MKNNSLVMLLLLITFSLSAQTYKLEEIFSDKTTETYMSHYRLIDGDNPDQLFALWGYQRYYDDWTSGAYEVEYFKGTAREFYSFISALVHFADKYKGEDQVLSYISGVKVKTLSNILTKQTLVYDKEEKVVCSFNARQWAKIRDRFTQYAEKQHITYR
ncbi:hypothetical protein [Sinomicrobium sp.]